MRILNVFLTINDQLMPNPLSLDTRNEGRVCYYSNVWKPTVVCITASRHTLFPLIIYRTQFY
jgi:hypothetical protein